jgi:hypothetical protein
MLLDLRSMTTAAPSLLEQAQRCSRERRVEGEPRAHSLTGLRKSAILFQMDTGDLERRRFGWRRLTARSAGGRQRDAQHERARQTLHGATSRHSVRIRLLVNFTKFAELSDAVS